MARIDRDGKLNMNSVYHITDETTWKAAQKKGVYDFCALASDGFIHLSKEEQVQRTHKRFFAGRGDLLLLKIDPEKLKAPLKFEDADGESFPHLYGELNLDAVIEAIPLKAIAD